MSDAGKKRRMRLGELLLAAGVIDEERLDLALAQQRKWGGRLGRILVDLGYVPEDLMARALARQLGLPRVDLDRHPIPPAAMRWIPVDLCEQYGVFPVARDVEAKVLHVATSDPTNQDALKEIAERTGTEVRPVMATASSIERAVRRHYYGEGAGAAAGDEAGLTGIVRTVERLERVVEGQVRSLRAVLELLLEAGLVDREAYLERLRRLED